MSNSTPAGKNFLGITWYRIVHHLRATLLTIFFAFLLTYLLCFLIGMIYPDFKQYSNRLFPNSWFSVHGIKYNLYTGEEGGVYAAIGNAITRDLDAKGKNNRGQKEMVGLFDDKDTLTQHPTSGGYDNFIKVTSQKNSFGIVQEAVMNMQDEQLRKTIVLAAPLFTERLHVFYRKDRFKGYTSPSGMEPELSADLDRDFIYRYNHTIRNIQVGSVGSCTRIIASDVLDLIERQVRENKEDKRFVPCHNLTHYSLRDAFHRLSTFDNTKSHAHGKDTRIDLMFYIGPDPIDSIKNILKAGKYGMMSVHPSFLGLLNKEFKLNLVVADFQRKYDSMEHISTVGTVTSLIASREVDPSDIKRMLKKIRDSTLVIQKQFISLPADCNDSCYIGIKETCRYQLPLCEFGYFKYFEDENKASKEEQTKVMIPFLIGIFSFLFPVFKSVGALKSIYRSWQINREIDQIIAGYSDKPEEMTTRLSALSARIADMYGDGELGEDHFNGLDKRIAIHFPVTEKH